VLKKEGIKLMREKKRMIEISEEEGNVEHDEWGMGLVKGEKVKEERWLKMMGQYLTEKYKENKGMKEEKEEKSHLNGLGFVQLMVDPTSMVVLQDSMV